MKVKKITSVILVGLFIIICASLIKDPTRNKESFHLSFSDDKSAYGSVEKIKARFDFPDYIYGGIVSHHLLAAVDIASFYASLAKQKVETVILIGPNHEGQGRESVAVSSLDFLTPWGRLETDQNIVKALVGEGVVKIDEEAFLGEHSISAEAPYIKYYLPQAHLVPIIMKRSVTKDNLLKLANALLKVTDSKTVVIASVDFSHHTNKALAEQNDQKSIAAISTFDFANLFTLNIDSPNTIFVLLKYLDGIRAKRLDYWQQNAATILNSPDYTDVTSYLFATFRKLI